MLRFHKPSALLALAMLVLGAGCAATTEDDADASQDAIQGSPTEARERNAATNESTFLAYFADAYAKAPLSEFTALPAGAGLVGAARADFATLSQACPKARFVVSAQRWTGEVPHEIPNAIELIERKMFTIDAYDTTTKRTQNVAVFDETGAFVFGLKLVEGTGKYEPGRAADFHKKLLVCR